jgi:hypothetical protein
LGSEVECAFRVSALPVYVGDADDDADDDNDNDRSADALATARERRAIPMEDGRGMSAFGSLTSSSLDVGSSVLCMLVLVAGAVTLEEPGPFFRSAMVLRFFRVVPFFFWALISSELMACWRATVEVEGEAEVGNV